MTDISDLERKMLQCDKQCAEHSMTQDAVKELKQCTLFNKRKLDKLSNKTSWLIGVMVLAGFLAGYGLNSIHGLEVLARKQEGTNQTLKSSNLRLPAIIQTQNRTSISIAKIQQTMNDMKQDIVEIKKILRDRN